MTRLQFKKCDHDTNTLFEQKQVHSKYGSQNNETCKNVFVEKSHKKYKPFSESELAKMFCRVVQGKFVVNIVECHNSKCDSRNRPSINQAVPCTGCKQNSEVSEIQIENQQNCYTQNIDLSDAQTMIIPFIIYKVTFSFQGDSLLVYDNDRWVTPRPSFCPVANCY